MSEPEPIAVPEQTALQLAEAHKAAMMSAVAGAVEMLRARQRSLPFGLTVHDQALLDGLGKVTTVLPLVMAYADEVQTQRNVLAARVAGDDSDTTAAELLTLVQGLMASWAAPGGQPLPTPTLPLVYTTQQAWQDGALAGWRAHAERDLQRVADRLA